MNYLKDYSLNSNKKTMTDEQRVKKVMKLMRKIIKNSHKRNPNLIK